MTIRTYKVVDTSTHQSPDCQLFKNELLAHAVNNTQITLSAQLILDELSLRREEQIEEREFTFRIYEIHFDKQGFFASVQDIETHLWSSLRVTDDVRFTVVS